MGHRERGPKLTRTEIKKIMRTTVGRHLCILWKNRGIMPIPVMKLERSMRIIYILMRSVSEKKTRAKQTKAKAKEAADKAQS